MTVDNLPIVIGAILVVAGLILTLWQMFTAKGAKPQLRHLTAGPHGIRMTTTYPGLIMIGLGVLLLLFGRIGR